MSGILRISGGELTLPSGVIVNADVSSSTEIASEKLKHIHKPGTNFAQAIGDTPVAREEIVFVAATNGTIRGFHAVLNDTGTTTDIDFDLKVNGVSVLSAVLNFTNADTDATPKDGTLSTTTFSVDDIISIEMIVTTSTGALGAFAWADLEESAP